MQIKNKHLLTMLVMAGISAAALPASAATFANGDILLAFNQTSGSGANTVLTLDLGNASQFVNAHNSSTNLTNIASLGSALGSTYGTSMLTSNDSTVFWSIAGVNASGGTLPNGDTNKTDYITQAQDGNTINNNGQVTANFNSGLGTRNTYLGQISSVQSSFASATGTTGPIAVPTGNTAWVANAQGNWGNFSLPTVVQGSFAAGTSGTALDLYRILGSSSASPIGSTYLGTFSLDSSGNLSFNTTVTAAPEPSRTLFAALGLGGLLLRRRRRVNA